MKLADIKTLADKTQLPEIEFSVDEIKSSKPGQYGTMYNVAISDGPTRSFATFATKKWSPEAFVGKRIRLVTGQNQNGQPTGIRTDQNNQYMNLWISDSAKVSVVGENGSAQTSPPAPTPRPFGAATPAPQPQAPPTPKLPPEFQAKRLAEEWVAVYNWTKDTFLGVLKEDQLPERVTSIVMGLRKNDPLGLILPPPAVPKKNWKEITIKGEKLSDFAPERLKNALIKLWRGELPAGEIADALVDVAKEPGFGPWAVYGHLLCREGIDDDVADTILLREVMAIREDSPPEMIINVISKPNLIEECKTFMAQKESALDQIPEL